LIRENLEYLREKAVSCRLMRISMHLMAEGAARARGGKLGSAKKLEPEDIERIYAAARG